jgi:hypothetical protein
LAQKGIGFLIRAAKIIDCGGLEQPVRLLASDQKISDGTTAYAGNEGIFGHDAVADTDDISKRKYRRRTLHASDKVRMIKRSSPLVHDGF